MDVKMGDLRYLIRIGHYSLVVVANLLGPNLQLCYSNGFLRLCVAAAAVTFELKIFSFSNATDPIPVAYAGCKIEGNTRPHITTTSTHPFSCLFPEIEANTPT